MRILFDPAVYSLCNKGNIAILQAAVHRMRKFWPEASIEIIALESQRLRLYVPDSRQVYPYSGGVAKKRLLMRRLYRFIPSRALKASLELQEAVRYQWKPLERGVRNFPLRRHVDRQFPGYEETPKALSTSNEINMSYAEITDGIDLLVATGGQYLADVVRYLAFCVLGRLDLAIQRGIPTVMVGQGIGPIEDSELIARAREVLPKVDVILIREKMYAPHLFASLGVSPERLFLTGDDAVEMAYDARSDGFGKEIGIGMRVTHYSEIEDDHLVALRQTLSEASRKHEARLMPIPISHHEFELDDQVIRYISAGKLARDRGLHVLDSPLDIIKKTGKCRVVVTGAYHPAVFALAQGIPAVCLSKSDHYANKFIGLADLFGRGCQVVFFDDVQFKEKLGDAIDFAWRSAETVRPELLEAARSQVEWGHAGYQRVHDLVDFKYHNVSRTLGQGTAFIGRQ